MVGERPTRWQKARQDWRGFQWTDLRIALFGALLGVGALAIARFPWEAVLELILVAGAGVVAALVYRLGELWWAWLQAPMRLLSADVTAIRARLDDIASTAPPMSEGEREELRQVRSCTFLTMSALEDCRTFLEKALETGEWWTISPPSEKWADCEGTLAGFAGARAAHASVRAAFRAFAPVNDQARRRAAGSAIPWGTQTENIVPAVHEAERDQLGDVLPLVNAAISELEALADELPTDT